MSRRLRGFSVLPPLWARRVAGLGVAASCAACTLYLALFALPGDKRVEHIFLPLRRAVFARVDEFFGLPPPVPLPHRTDFGVPQRDLQDMMRMPKATTVSDVRDVVAKMEEEQQRPQQPS